MARRIFFKYVVEMINAMDSSIFQFSWKFRMEKHSNTSTAMLHVTYIAREAFERLLDFSTAFDVILDTLLMSWRFI